MADEDLDVQFLVYDYLANTDPKLAAKMCSKRQRDELEAKVRCPRAF